MSFANTTIKPSKDLATQVKSELNKIDLNFEALDGQTLRIRFMLNEQNEIIVVSTNNKKLDRAVKNALNYEKVDSGNLQAFQIYVLPVTFETK